ncbi:MAG: hypothetical protein KGD63_14905 [Candidatus Lokiarchaeota archaeon]|nr:hypothetical protein [Candidatus Lokiarchaeota archaeon]
MSIKILLIGKPAVGKTTIKKIIFEGVNPLELLKSSLDPTRGIESKVYKWMDLELGLFDISGQELNIILREEEESIRSFANTNAFIYIIEYYKWKSSFQEYIDDINRIYNIIIKYNLKSQLILFLHKIDLLDRNKSKINFQKIKKEILNLIKLPIIPKIYVTSIIPKYIYYLYEAFFNILVSFSEHIYELKNIIDEILQKYSKIFCIVRNISKSIIVQSMTKDFDPDLISDVYRRIIKEALIPDKKGTIALKINKIKDVGLIISDVYRDNKEITHPLIKNIIYIFEKTEEKKIRELMTKIRKKVSNYYLKWAENNLFVK